MKLHVTASIGVAQIVDRQSPPALVQSADEALYAAKQAGRNRVQLHEASAATPRAKEPTTTPASDKSPSPATEVNSRTQPEAPAGQLRTDVQTGLPNRTAFCEDIHRRLAEAHRLGNRLSLMLIKVDNLGDLVLQHGPILGDLVLRTCTQFLSAAMRDMDLVARYTNDVFGIILPGTALVHATGAGERLRSAIENCPLRLLDRDIRFSISAGVAEAQPGEDLVSFMTRTEAAQNASLAAGGNKVHFHTGISVETLPQAAAS